MFKGFVLSFVALAVLSACSSTIKTEGYGDRNPAASDDADRLQTSFDAMMADENPEERMLDFMKRLNLIYHRTNFEVKQFDEEVANMHEGSELADSDAYVKLIALWGLRRRMEHKIEYFYTRLLNEAHAPNGVTAPNAEVAGRILGRFNNYVNNEAGPIGFIAQYDLARELNHIVEDHNTYLQAQPNEFTPAVNPYNTSFRNLMSNVNALSESAQNNKNLLDMAANLAAQQEDPVFEEAFEKTKAEMARTSRAPNSASGGYICVHPGPNGNITGNAFSPKGTWAITYDDGPHKTRSRMIADMFAQRGEKATFFWLAKNVNRYKAEAAYIRDLGMEIANHSYSHPNVPTVSSGEARKQILSSTDAIENATGVKIKHFRLPYGSGARSCTRERKLIAQKGMIHLFWNVDSLDWQDRNAASIHRRVTGQMRAKGKGVVLFHDIHRQAVEATRLLLDWIDQERSRGNNIKLHLVRDLVKPEDYKTRCEQERRCS